MKRTILLSARQAVLFHSRRVCVTSAFQVFDSFNILPACCFSIHALLPGEIRLSAGELKKPGEGGSVSCCGRVQRERMPAAASWQYTACVALRTPNANAEPYLHVLTCTVPANVQHFHNQRWPVLHGSPSKYDNAVRWSREDGGRGKGGGVRVRKGQRVKTDFTIFPPSIHHISVDLIPLYAIFCHYHWWYYCCLWCQVTFRGQNCTFLY